MALEPPALTNADAVLAYLAARRGKWVSWAELFDGLYWFEPDTLADVLATLTAAGAVEFDACELWMIKETTNEQR